MNDLTILIPAAGASSRMKGADKLLIPVGGVPLLARQTRAALSLGVPVVVVLRSGDSDRRAALQGLSVEIAEVPDLDIGMGYSIATGAAVAKQGRILILPADMPLIGVRELVAITTAAGIVPDCIWRGMDAEGVPGHPVIFPVRLRQALLRLTGDDGARDLLTAERVMMAALPGKAATLDLDTPEDWAAYRQ